MTSTPFSEIEYMFLLEGEFSVLSLEGEFLFLITIPTHVFGRGMQFINRDSIFPNDWWKMNMYGSTTGPGPPSHYFCSAIIVYFFTFQSSLSHQTIATFVDYIQDTLDKYNGNNEQEVYAYARKIGFFHSPIPDPQNFVLGILSVEEKNLISDVLMPVEQKVHKAHLLSVQDDADDDNCVILKLRRCELKLTEYELYTQVALDCVA